MFVTFLLVVAILAVLVVNSSADATYVTVTLHASTDATCSTPQYSFIYKVGSCVQTDSTVYHALGLNYLSETVVQPSYAEFTTSACTTMVADTAVGSTIAATLGACTQIVSGQSYVKVTTNNVLTVPNADGTLYSAFPDTTAGESTCTSASVPVGKAGKDGKDGGKGGVTISGGSFYYFIHSTTCDNSSPLGAASTNGLKYSCSAGVSSTIDYDGAVCTSTPTTTAADPAATTCAVAGSSFNGFTTFADLWTAGPGPDLLARYRVDCAISNPKTKVKVVTKQPKAPKADRV